MDSVPLEMDDIFGEFDGEDDDEGGFNPSRLPDLEDELEPMRDMRQDEGNQEEEEDFTDNAELLAKLKSMKGASKNTTKRTMPKLDATRLTGERGMAILPKSFERVRLKGRNHEAEDLKIIMHTLQHWGHRLFPKMTFDEILERVERLGAKKEVQTCLKKIRLDIPVLASDMIEDEEDAVQRVGDERESVSVNREEDERSQDISRLDGSQNEISDEELEDLLRDQGQPVERLPVIASQNSAQCILNSGLSDEVRKRIEENKRKALERRAAKAAASDTKINAIANPNGPDINGDTLDMNKHISKEEEITKDVANFHPKTLENHQTFEDMSDTDIDLSKTKDMELTDDAHNSFSKTAEDNQTNTIPSPGRLFLDPRAESLPEETGPFQIHGVGESETLAESMEFEVREVNSDNEDCAALRIVEENLTLKGQEEDEVREGNDCDQSTKTREQLEQKQDENKYNISQMIENDERKETS